MDGVRLELVKDMTQVEVLPIQLAKKSLAVSYPWVATKAAMCRGDIPLGET